MAQCPPDCRPGEVPLGRRTGPPLPEAEDGDSANRDELCKILGPKLGRVLPMAAAATPRGRPQYAAPRDEIASSASGDRCRSALEPGLPVATCMVRALAEMDQNNSRCSIHFLLQQSRAGSLRELRSGRAGPAYAAEAVPPGTRYYLFSEIFSPEWPVKHPTGASGTRAAP